MPNQTRRSLLSVLPLAAVNFNGPVAPGDHTEAQLLLRYLAYDRLDRLLSDEARELRAALLKCADESAELEARLRALPAAKADSEQALVDPQLSADGVQYLRDESANLAQEEAALLARLPQLKAQQAEITHQLERLRQRREKLTAELAAIERRFNIELPA